MSIREAIARRMAEPGLYDEERAAILKGIIDHCHDLLADLRIETDTIVPLDVRYL